MPRKKSALAQRRARKRNIFIGLAMFLFVALLVLVGFLVRLPRVTIVETRVDGTHFIDPQAVQELVTEKLEGSYVWLIPYKNSLFYPEQGIERSLKETFLPIQLVEVSRDGFTKLVVAIEEREPFAVWCASQGTSSPCYFMDKTGFLFKTGEVNLGFVTYQGGVSGEPLGSYFLDGEFPTLQTLLESVHTSTKRSVDTVVVDEHSDVYFHFREGGEIRFVREYDVQVLSNSVDSVFNSKRFETEDQFEYADFRFGNKVYIKFEEE